MLRSGHVVAVHPLQVSFNGAFWFEALHMLLAGYMVAGFVVAGVYAVDLLRGDGHPGLGVAQYPYLLGTHLPIAAAAAPLPTLSALTVVAAAALVLVVPSMGLLFVLQQRGRLGKSP
ncbi:cytochrome ubiquinol oxidase subunit I [Pseudonocardia sp. NPDC049154]|uniref:cytochrome ubiquinol oxidase subunit I n=1 Tax=Pseudonocardia sp. NPDC049154 TaxID=3155501 RepID=UPI0033DCA6D6